MRKVSLSIIQILFFFLSIHSFSQEFRHTQDMENESQYDNHESDHFKKHAISLIVSHTHIGSGINKDSGNNKWLALPSFGLNYNYNFNEKWAIGLHNHMIIEEFVVKDNNSEDNFNRSGEDEIVGIKRGRPVSVAIMATYNIYQHIALLAGAGMEFSSHEDFVVVKFGLEFPFHIPNDWELVGVLAYDINIDAYHSFTFGIGIAKLF